MFKCENMVSSRGNSVPNQFIISDKNIDILQSYKSIIAKRENGRVTLDAYYWNYSRTTGKYRCMFLGESRKETEEKIKSGVYVLADLNA